MKSLTSKKNNRSFLFSGLSIQQRLSLSIFFLLLFVIVAFSWTSYIGVKRAAFDMNKERLRALSEQISSLLGQNAQVTMVGTRTAAAHPAMKAFLLTEGKMSDTSALRVLERLRSDSLWIRAELMDTRRNILLHSTLPGTVLNIKEDSILALELPAADSSIVGKLYRAGDTICYPVIASVTDNKQIIGYVVRWRVQKATAKSVAQLSQLLGDNATLYIGNSDGTLWTDLLTVVPPPPTRIDKAGNVVAYSRPGMSDVLATAMPMAGTNWMVLIEVSQKRTNEATGRFFQWVVIIGTVLIGLGILVAWIISRNITKPLNKLTDAASIIASGDYSVSVEEDRQDELGQLAHAFNTMAVKVKNVQSILERKVQQRTSDLEKANKELESFSYSVSHDLRAPLRIINGYTEILMADYSGKVDDEAVRMLNIIAANAKKMGRLIDDLLNLSRLGRKELVVHSVNMEQLVKSVINEPTRDNHNARIRIGNLEDAECDSSLIRQVWVNLISNAVKYSGKKEEPIIEVDSYKNATEIVYKIKDNGVGFDMQYSNKLFGVFQRLHKMTEYEGTGVGLALVQRIVTSHGGRVWAEGEVGNGATFYFSLPISRTTDNKYETANQYDRIQSDRNTIG